MCDLKDRRAAVPHYTHKAIVYEVICKGYSVSTEGLPPWSSVYNHLSNQIHLFVRAAMHVLSQVDLLWQITRPHHHLYITSRAPVFHLGDIRHVIKHALLASNGTVLRRSLSRTPWPFLAFYFAGCQARWCSRMESLQRTRDVLQGEEGL